MPRHIRGMNLMRAVATSVACRMICMLGTLVDCAKMDELIVIQLGGQTHVGPKSHVDRGLRSVMVRVHNTCLGIGCTNWMQPVARSGVVMLVVVVVVAVVGYHFVTKHDSSFLLALLLITIHRSDDGMVMALSSAGETSYFTMVFACL